MATARIIFLNGVASSGKAEISAALQERLEEPYLYYSVDAQLHMIPQKLMSEQGQDLGPVAEEILMDLLPRLISTIHMAIQLFASQGVNLIVDHVLQRKDWRDECVSVLSDHQVLFVGVRCSIEELERRELEGSRVAGLAGMQLDAVHADMIYDLEVDTCKLNPDECAQEIIKVLHSGESPRAFQHIRASLDSR